MGRLLPKNLYFDSFSAEPDPYQLLSRNLPAAEPSHCGACCGNFPLAGARGENSLDETKGWRTPLFLACEPMYPVWARDSGTPPDNPLKLIVGMI